MKKYIILQSVIGLIFMLMVSNTVLAKSIMSVKGDGFLIVNKAHIKKLRRASSALFMEITNRGLKNKRLLYADSPDAAKVSLSSYSVSNGMLEVKELDSIYIPSNEKISLESPGWVSITRSLYGLEGIFIRLHGLKRSLSSGDKIKVDLVFEGGIKFTILADVVG